MLLQRIPCACPICHAWPLQERVLPWCESCEKTWQHPLRDLPLYPQLQSMVQGHTHALAFDWPWQDFVRRFKLLHDTGWAKAWGHIMGQALLNEHPGVAGWDWVGMPQTPKRWAERGGYDPVALLVAHTRSWLHSQHQATGHWVQHALCKRTDHAQVQHHLKRQERWQSVSDAFCWVSSASGSRHAQQVVLVDDILTTGATLHAAALALRSAGYTQIWALTLARTPPPAPQDRAQCGAFRDHHVSHRSGST